MMSPHHIIRDIPMFVEVPNDFSCTDMLKSQWGCELRFVCGEVNIRDASSTSSHTCSAD